LITSKMSDFTNENGVVDFLDTLKESSVEYKDMPISIIELKGDSLTTTIAGSPFAKKYKTEKDIENVGVACDLAMALVFENEKIQEKPFEVKNNILHIKLEYAGTETKKLGGKKYNSKEYKLNLSFK